MQNTVNENKRIPTNIEIKLNQLIACNIGGKILKFLWKQFDLRPKLQYVLLINNNITRQDCLVPFFGESYIIMSTLK